MNYEDEVKCEINRDFDFRSYHLALTGNANENIISVYAIGENKLFELTSVDLVRCLIFTLCKDYN